MSNVALVRYDAARRAPAEAVKVDDVKQIQDMAMAAQVYARQQRDPELLNHATEIRKRAARRLGEILGEMKAKGERHSTGGDYRSSVSRKVDDRSPPTLANLGLKKHEALRAQQLAAMPAEQFEQHLVAAEKQADASIDRAASAEEKKARRAERKLRSARGLQTGGHSALTPQYPDDDRIYRLWHPYARPRRLSLPSKIVRASDHVAGADLEDSRQES